jgi:anti-sigma B factor antagonist
MAVSPLWQAQPDHGLPAHARVVGSVVGRRTVLSVSGEIDIASALLLTDAVDDALRDGALELWIDLTRTDFMDSTGLHALLEAHRRVHELNRRLAVICPDGPVGRLFEIAGLTGELPLYADRAAAHHGA